MASLVADYSDSDDDESGNEPQPSASGSKVTVQPKPGSPLIKGSVTDIASVFNNPYQQAAKEKQRLLEAMGPLVDLPPPRKPGQKTCRYYKQGTCRYGDRCHNYHDTTHPPILPQNRPEASEAAGATNVVTNNPPSMYHPSALIAAQNYVHTPEPEDEDHYMYGRKKKKRQGLTDSLIPPKKARKSFNKQRVEERPWTNAPGGSSTTVQAGGAYAPADFSTPPPGYGAGAGGMVPRQLRVSRPAPAQSLPWPPNPATENIWVELRTAEGTPYYYNGCSIGREVSWSCPADARIVPHDEWIKTPWGEIQLKKSQE